MKLVKNWFEELMSHDRRRAKRHDASSLVAYYWDGAAPAAHPIRDISSTGFYLVTEQRWYPGTMVMMRLQRNTSADAGSEGSIAVQAKVVRAGEDGVGLAFVLPEPRNGHRPRDLSDQGPADKKTLVRFLSPM